MLKHLRKEGGLLPSPDTFVVVIFYLMTVGSPLVIFSEKLGHFLFRFLSYSSLFDVISDPFII
jgi:hypothetical protein